MNFYEKFFSKAVDVPFRPHYVIKVKDETVSEKGLRTLDPKIKSAAPREKLSGGHTSVWIEYPLDTDPLDALKDKVGFIYAPKEAESPYCNYFHVWVEAHGGTSLTSNGTVATRAGVQLAQIKNQHDNDFFALTYKSKVPKDVLKSKWLQFVGRELCAVTELGTKYHFEGKFTNEQGSYPYSAQDHKGDGKVVYHQVVDGEGFYGDGQADLRLRTFKEHTIYDKPGLGFQQGSLQQHFVDEWVKSKKCKEIVSRVNFDTYLLCGDDHKVVNVVRWTAEYTTTPKQEWTLAYKVIKNEAVKALDDRHKELGNKVIQQSKK